MNGKMNHIATWLGGSHMYNLNTPASDMDMRGLFLHDDTDAIIGLRRYDQQTTNTKEADEHYVELRFFFSQLERGTLNYLEPLWNPSQVVAHGPEWRAIQPLRDEFFPTTQISGKITGFLRSQFQDTFDDLKASKPESIRGQSIAKYGYHPKSAMHTMRLAETGCVLFDTGEFRVAPVYNHDICLKLKTQPESFKPSEVREMMINAEQEFETARRNTQIEVKTFNRDLANEIILSCYAPIILAKALKRIG